MKDKLLFFCLKYMFILELFYCYFFIKYEIIGRACSGTEKYFQ